METTIPITINASKRSYMASYITKLKADCARLAYNAAQRIRTQARALAPVLTGYLKSSILLQRLGVGHYKIVVKAKYGLYVEFGTRYMRAQPFLTPAAQGIISDFAAQARGILKQINNAGGVPMEVDVAA